MRSYFGDLCCNDSVSSLSPAMAFLWSRSRRWRDGASRGRRRDDIDATPSTRRHRDAVGATTIGREDDAVNTKRTPLQTVTRFIGSTTNIRGIRSRASCDKCDGSEYIPDLIFLNRFGIDSSSNGSDPHNNA